MKRVVSKISKVYAQAIFESYQDAVLKDFGDVVRFMSDNDNELYNALVSPLLRKEQMVDMIRNIFKDRLGKEMFDCLMLIADKKRVKQVFEIYELYVNLIDEKDGFVCGEFRIPTRSSKEEETMVSDVVSSILGKKTKIDFIKDENMIAGFQGMAGDKFLDYSIRGHLKQLENELK